MRFLLFAPLLILLASCANVEVESVHTASDADREAILQVVQTTFDAIATGDRAVWESVLLEEGTFTSIRGEAGSRSVGYSSFEQSLARQDSQDRGYLERMWDQVVLVDGDIAMVWTPYDFHINGNFSHAGIDVIVLLRTDAGWKIATIVWSVEPEQREGAPELTLADG